MKRITIVLTALLLAMTSSPILAKKKQHKTKQQKAELRAWKKRKAAISPMQLKELIEENSKLKKHVKEIREAQEALEELIRFKTQLLAQKEAQRQQEAASTHDNRTNKRAYLEHSMIGPGRFSKNDWTLDENGQLYIKGVVFKVQIGAYKHRDLNRVLEGEENQEVFIQEQSGGLNRYTLMHFKDYWQANQFKKELRAMGLKDAFVVAFRDGKRVPLKAVLPKVIQQKK